MTTTGADIEGTTTTFVPDLLYAGGRFLEGFGLVCDREGRVVALLPVGPVRETLRADPREGEAYDVPALDHYSTTRFVYLRGRAVLPGMVNAHSHAFQRVIRGRTEYRGSSSDSFWTWREMMYAAAERLTPEDIYDASRMAFMEMALAGITSVGEFHYLHRAPGGGAYDDPNLLALEVVRAARDVGLRIALLRVAYARAGFGKEPDPRQLRFVEPDHAAFMRDCESLARALEGDRYAWAGVAPHSVRALPVEYLRSLRSYAYVRHLPLHMHVAEQPAEVEACVAEHGRTPVALLADEGVLSPRFTAVHAVHVTPEEVKMLAKARASVCACPTTERNLGDGVVPADAYFEAGVRVSLGTDSHTQIDPLEDARELEYHLRLKTLRRNVLAPVVDESVGEGTSRVAALAARLFDCASLRGAESIGAPAGEFEPGRAADFFTVDLEDPAVAGASKDDLLPAIVFSSSRAAVRETAVGGRLVVEHGRHPAQDEIVSRFNALQRKLWS